MQRRRSIRRKRHGRVAATDVKTQIRVIRLTVCAVILMLTILVKLISPGAMTWLSGFITSAVDYKSAFEILGEGLSGEKKFISALGEAFTYAFAGTSVPDGEAPHDENDKDAVETFSERTITDFEGPASSVGSTADAPADSSTESDAPEDHGLLSAVVSAFLNSQESFSDYSIPAGVTYDIPVLGVAYDSPVTGRVSSSFGYRIHPVDGSVKFHYGTDIASAKGTDIRSFADGVVTAIGESTTLGKYIIISHIPEDGGQTVTTQYAHCDEIYVSGNQTVKLGDVIATVGATGNATSDNLHFELKLGDTFVNPEFYVVFDDAQI